jgi:putative heme-binding domain-containing protein
LGVETGPSLASLTEKSPEALLIAILDPNRAFESRYTNFTIATKDGRLMTGLITSETANSVTLRHQEGKEDVVLRTDIEEMAASGQSFMPEGLEKGMSVRDMANLLAFLVNVERPPKPFPGNHPRVVKPGFDGKITLNAADAEVFGDRLTFEQARQNLDYWMAPNDRAVWKFDVARPGRYEVWLDGFCARDAAGNVLELRLGLLRILHKVVATKSLDRECWRKIGEIELSGRTNRLEIRPAAAPCVSLLDLRCVELRPLVTGHAVSEGPRVGAADRDSRGLAARSPN